MTITGGCLCGAVRYTASAPPQMQGLCYCADCRKASGSAFIPFMNFAAADIVITGEARQHAAKSIRGTDAVRNFCPVCGGLVFGGIIGVDAEHTVYAGSLDDQGHFKPTIAIFDRDRPAWLALPAGLAPHATMPDTTLPPALGALIRPPPSPACRCSGADGPPRRCGTATASHCRQDRAHSGGRR